MAIEVLTEIRGQAVRLTVDDGRIGGSSELCSRVRRRALVEGLDPDHLDEDTVIGLCHRALPGAVVVRDVPPTVTS